MADRPIIFSAPMVRALLACRKTQTRRVLKPQPYEYDGRWWIVDRHSGDCHLDMWARGDVGSRPILPGDRLWVREAFCFDGCLDDLPPRAFVAEQPIIYLADDTLHYRQGIGWWPVESPGRYRHARFMPRRFSRLTLTITNVRVQMLQEINELDAVSEGVWKAARYHDGSADWFPTPTIRDPSHKTARDAYASLWDQINGRGAWVENPWVVAYTFTVHPQNIDRMEAAHA